MFNPDDILYEDNHLLIVNKRCGDLVQPDPSGESALEDQIKAFIKRRDAKPGEVFLGVVHRIDRPVSGAVVFAKTSKALVRLNEMIREGRIHKVYWALTEATPDPESGELRHYILRDGRTNRSRACDAPKGDAKEARLRYATLGAGTNYTLVEVELLTGRHHQIRAQLSKVGCPIRGDLKYGARRSLPGGGISLHSRRVEFEHPVRAALGHGSRACGRQPVDLFRKPLNIPAMRLLIQRVKHASVAIGGDVRSRIGAGLLVLLGVGCDDTDEDIEYLAGKLVRLRIFDDEAGVMNLDVVQTGGEILVVSQFTLQASTRKGNRPSYIKAAPEAVSRPLYERFTARVAELLGRGVATGEFGADMQVELVNDGPVTIWMDSKNKE